MKEYKLQGHDDHDVRPAKRIGQRCTYSTYAQTPSFAHIESYRQHGVCAHVSRMCRVHICTYGHVLLFPGRGYAHGHHNTCYLLGFGGWWWWWWWWWWWLGFGHQFGTQANNGIWPYTFYTCLLFQFYNQLNYYIGYTDYTGYAVKR